MSVAAVGKAEPEPRETEPGVRTRELRLVAAAQREHPVAAAPRREVTQMYIPSSLIEWATTSPLSPDWTQAVLSWLKIVPSLIRVSLLGSLGDCPCFADRIITV